MLQAYKILTININRIWSDLKLAALQQFVYESEADIVFLQEVLTTTLHITGFQCFLNVAPEYSTGVALLVRDGIPIQEVEKLESGRGIGCKIYDITFVNLYAPSGTSNKLERTIFFTEDIIYLLRRNPQNIIIGGDFNCVLNRKDQTPNFNFCKALHDLVKKMRFKDAWEVKYPTLVKFTFFTSSSCSRLDRMYISDSLTDKVLVADVIPASFSDHSALSVTINLPRQPTKMYRNQWHLNTSLLKDDQLKDIIKESWTLCLRSINRYPSKSEWWTQFGKKKVRQSLISYSRQKAREEKQTSEFYYCVLRDLYDKPQLTNTELQQIKEIKAKLLCVKRKQLEALKIKSKSKSLAEEETASLYHLVKHYAHRKRTFIDELVTEDGTLLTQQPEIVQEIYRHYEHLYAEEEIDDTQLLQTVNFLNSVITPEENTEFLSEFTVDEVWELVSRSPSNKSPGPDGLPKEFYLSFWDVIGPIFTDVVNEIVKGGIISRDMKEGKIVLVPKSKGRKKIDSFRPITLMNFDYKTVARAINERLTPLIRKVVHTHQTCFPGRSIMTATSEYRDLISIVAVTNIKCALLFLDFRKAFDQVSHRYIERILQQIGMEDRGLAVIHNMITDINASVSINGQLTKAIPIRRGIPQGSPLSMLLYVLSLEPLLRRIDEKLTGVNMSGAKFVARAYADDVGVVIRQENEIDILKKEIDTYSKASGGKINTGKCKILNLRGLDHVDVPWARAVESHKTLGITITNCPIKMSAINWKETADKIRGAIIDNKCRSVNLIQKIKIVNTYIFAKAYYVAQTFPMPKLQGKKIMQLASRYVWQGSIFKMKYTDLAKSRENGGLGLIDIFRKALALFLKRTILLLNNERNTITAKLFTAVRPARIQQHINVDTINYKLKHVKEFYVELSKIGESTMHKTYLKTKEIIEIWQQSDSPNSVETKYPLVRWNTVWKNLSLKLHSTDVVSSWYKVVNNLIATNEKLHKIGISDTDKCLKCGLVDTLIHRFTCGNRLQHWKWVQTKLGLLTRSSATSYTTEILLWPDVKFYPAKKNNTVMWLLGNYVNYVVNGCGGESAVEFQLHMAAAYFQIKGYTNLKTYFGNMIKIVFEKEGIG